MMIWLFDDDFNHEWGPDWGKSARTYSDNQRSSKQDHVLIIPGATGGSIKRYGTWDGSESADPAGTVVNGALHVRVGDFSIDPSHPAETWDGADVVLIIE